jgi:hypothetical protein
MLRLILVAGVVAVGADAADERAFALERHTGATMANASEWMSLLTENGWIDGDGKIVAPGESTVKIQLPEGRSFTVRGGKAAPPIRLVGEFFLVLETNVDSAGRGRLTGVPLSSVLSIESLS